MRRWSVNGWHDRFFPTKRRNRGSGDAALNKHAAAIEQAGAGRVDGVLERQTEILLLHESLRLGLGV